MLYLSKSKYCGLWQCPKIAWMNKYKPEERVIDDGLASRMTAGTEVGELARNLFGAYVDVTVRHGESLDLKAMIDRTSAEMKKGTPVICEAAFEYNGLYCAVDILKAENDGWALYEVKSSTDDSKDIYVADVAYQKYVLEHCGVNVTGVNLVVLNNQYVRHGELDLQELFKITDISDSVGYEEELIEDNITVAEKILADDSEPDIPIAEHCHVPYSCSYWSYCTRDVPKPSVFDLYRMPFVKKLGFFQQGLVTYRDLWREAPIKNEKQLRQIEYALEDKGTYIDAAGIREFLDKLFYPLYFLDFETMQPVIPLFDGTRPYQQIPFQYSLHYIEEEGRGLKHKEHLGISGTDTRRALAEQLCRDIPKDVCVTAYNKAFECTRIKEMAEDFPDLADHLLNIRDHIVDLLTPFQSGYYYNRAMGGSFSIKSVLPAIFPDDPSLNYHNLEGVHNGGEAMSVFPLIKDMAPEDQEKARHDLLEYCKLDTYAMVKVWEELVNVSK